MAVPVPSRRVAGRPVPPLGVRPAPWDRSGGGEGKASCPPSVGGLAFNAAEKQLSRFRRSKHYYCSVPRCTLTLARVLITSK